MGPGLGDLFLLCPCPNAGSFCGIFSRCVSLDVSVNVGPGLWDLILLCPCPNAGSFCGIFSLCVSLDVSVNVGWGLGIFSHSPSLAVSVNKWQGLWDLFLLPISVHERRSGFGDLSITLSLSECGASLLDLFPLPFSVRFNEHAAGFTGSSPVPYLCLWLFLSLSLSDFVS